MGSSPAYPSDLTDAQWALIEPLVPARSSRGRGTRGGRPLKYSRRRIVEATLAGMAPTGAAELAGDYAEKIPVRVVAGILGLDWRDAGLSFFRNFPHLTLRLDDLTVANRGRFEGDTLAAVRHLGVVVDVGSLVGHVLRGKSVVVRGVELDQPRLSLIALEDGTANWSSG
jgi:hypothetical protein